MTLSPGLLLCTLLRIASCVSSTSTSLGAYADSSMQCKWMASHLGELVRHLLRSASMPSLLMARWS